MAPNTYKQQIPSVITDPVERDFYINRLRQEVKQQKINDELKGRLLNIEKFLDGLKLKKGEYVLTFMKIDVEKGNYEIEE